MKKRKIFKSASVFTKPRKSAVFLGYHSTCLEFDSRLISKQIPVDVLYEEEKGMVVVSYTVQYRISLKNICGDLPTKSE